MLTLQSQLRTIPRLPLQPAQLGNEAACERISPIRPMAEVDAVERVQPRICSGGGVAAVLVVVVLHVGIKIDAKGALAQPHMACWCSPPPQQEGQVRDLESG